MGKGRREKGGLGRGRVRGRVRDIKRYVLCAKQAIEGSGRKTLTHTKWPHRKITELVVEMLWDGRCSNLNACKHF